VLKLHAEGLLLAASFRDGVEEAGFEVIAAMVVSDVVHAELEGALEHLIFVLVLAGGVLGGGELGVTLLEQMLEVLDALFAFGGGCAYGGQGGELELKFGGVLAGRFELILELCFFGADSVKSGAESRAVTCRAICGLAQLRVACARSGVAF
jgi:hypothetical protein